MKIKLAHLIMLLGLAMLPLSCRFSGFTTMGNPGPKLSKATVFAPDFLKALYKTELTLHGRTITGIIVIKKVDDGYQMAMVSEVGLKYFEFFFPEGSPFDAQAKYVMAVLDREPLKEALISCFGLLFREAKYNSQTRLKINESKTKVLLIDKEKSSRFSYYYNPISGEVGQLMQNRFFGTRTSIKLSNYKNDAPGSILVYRGKISMNLQRL
ncbi:MAG: hypothetical protein A2W85_00745 [Bacteroidetes bacterium GWF2_41_31]|nr:MAG: hypothetical protein A2W85_00745 [Bacteroidetes bacterium GWF2_41_31]